MSDRRRDADRRRRREKPWRNWYERAAWLRRRAAQLVKQPLCERCLAEGRVVPATIAHHVERHEGDWDKFINGELASSCKTCHDSIEQRIEALGYDPGVDTAGRPVDPNHPWNQTRSETS
ncbi:MAG: HNH endonuclease [Hyphomicrobiales bacterium]|nr:HNH endonuclease [Hyphomicrobiales bacterium]